MRVVVGAGFVGTAFRDGFGAFHHERVAEWAYRSGGFCFDCVFAFGVVGAAVKYSEAAAPAYHLACLADRTRDAGLFAATLGVLVFFNIFALGIAGARNKFAVASLAFNEFSFFAFRARLAGLARRVAHRAVQGTHAAALGEVPAA